MILKIEEFRELIEDLAVIDKRRGESAISHEKLDPELKRAG